MANCPRCGAQTAEGEVWDGRCGHCATFIRDIGSAPSPRQTVSVIGEKNFVASLPKFNESLVKPRELSAEDERRLAEKWEPTIAKSLEANAEKTLNTSSNQGEFQTRLRIGVRSRRKPNQDIKADYEIEEKIGEGGMAEVWRARQASLDRYVAVKIPKRGIADSPEGQSRFVSEVVVTGKLEHPNIVPIYDMGKDDSGTMFYSMKHVQGDPWNTVIRTRTLSENLEILMKVCDAISFAHSRGFLHRDIKPSNVMVGEYGEVSVMDWGIAYAMVEDADAAWFAQATGPAGTPAYMAPEMADAVTTGQLDVTSDVYLLGAVLFEIITGFPPHPPKLKTMDMLLAAARNEIVPTQEKGELVAIAHRSMVTEPENRYPTVEAFKDALRQYQSHAHSAELTTRARQWLDDAERTNEYTDYQKAVFGFQNALDLWTANPDAAPGLSHARLAYAKTAMSNGDFELGLITLDRQDPEHASLIRELENGKRDRDQRDLHLRRARNFIRWGIAAFLCIVTVALAVIWKQSNANAHLAHANEQKAAVNKKLADENERKAAVNKKLAEDNEQKAAVNKKLADENEQKAAVNKKLADENEHKAAVNKKLAEARRRSEREAKRASYRSDLSLAAESLQRNDFDGARDLLNELSSVPETAAQRHWGWAHLKFVTDLSVKQFGRTEKNDPIGPVESVAMSRNWIVAGAGNGELYAWNPESGQKLSWKHGTKVVAVSVCETASGTYVASSGQSQVGQTQSFSVRLWNLKTVEGEVVPIQRELAATANVNQRIVGISFSEDGTQLLLGSADATAQLYDRKGNEPLRVFRGHQEVGPVWSATFSPNGKWVLTAGEDGTVRVWSTESAQELARSERSHVGAVYTAAFSPNGKQIVTGGADRRLLVWDVPDLTQLSTENFRAERVETIKSLILAKDLPGDRADAYPLGDHDAAVRSISFPRDRKNIVMSAGDDNVIKIWDLEFWDQKSANPLIKVLRGHGGKVRSIVASNDGEQVLTGSYDGRVLYWRWRNVQVPLVLTPPAAIASPGFNFACFSPDEQWIAAAATDGTALIWDMLDPQQPSPQVLTEGHTWLTTRAVVYNHGARLLTAAGDNTTRLWDLRRGNELGRLGQGWYASRGHGGTGWRGVAAVSHDGQWVATGSEDGEKPLKLWKTTPSEAQPEAETVWALRGEPLVFSDVTAVAFSPDDQRLLVGDASGACFLVNRLTAAIEQKYLDLHRDVVTAVAFLPDGRYALTAGFDGYVTKLDLQSGGKTRLPHGSAVLSMDVSSDGSRAVTASQYSRNDTSAAVLRLWDLNRGEPMAPVQMVTAPQLASAHGVNLQSNDQAKSPFVIRSVVFDDEDRQALVTVYLTQPNSPAQKNQKNQLATWDLNHNYRRLWKETAVGDLSSAIYGPESTIITVGGKGARLRSPHRGEEMMNYRPQQAEATAVCFSPDGQLVAVASIDGSVKLWRMDQRTRKWLPDLKMAAVHKGGVSCVAFHPLRSDLLLTAGKDGQVRFWRKPDEQWLSEDLKFPEQRIGAVNHVAFSPHDGRRLLIGCADHAVRIYDMEANKVVHRLHHNEETRCGSFSGDGQWVVTAGGRNIHFWNSEGVLKGSKDAHTAAISSVVFSHDGRRVVTASEDYTVKLWDTRELVEGEAKEGWEPNVQLTLEGHTGEVRSVAFSPTGRDVVSAGRDKQVIIWRGLAVEPSFQITNDELEYTYGASPLLISDAGIQVTDPTNADFSNATFGVQMEGPSESESPTPERRYPFVDLEQLDANATAGWQKKTASNGRLEFVFDAGAADRRTAAESLSELVSSIQYQHDEIEKTGKDVPLNGGEVRESRRTLKFELSGVQYKDHDGQLKTFPPIAERLTITLVEKAISPEEEGPSGTDLQTAKIH